MKNKGKKIIKGIAVGAVACLSVGLLAGCEMSEADIEKYDNEIVEAKELLQTQIDELKKQNDALTSQNAELEEQNSALEELNENLEEQNQILKDESLKMTDEQVYDILKMVEANFLTNKDGVRDNLRITGSYTTSDGRDQTLIKELYKSETKGYVSYYYGAEGAEWQSTLDYSSDGKIFRYQKNDENGYYSKKDQTQTHNSVESSANIDTMLYGMTLLDYETIPLHNKYYKC